MRLFNAKGWLVNHAVCRCSFFSRQKSVTALVVETLIRLKQRFVYQ